MINYQMKQRKFSRRWLILFLIIVILLIARVSVNYFASMFARQKLEAAFSNNQQYKSHLETLHADVFTGSVVVTNVQVHPAGSPSRDTMQQVSFAASSINISGIGWYSLLFKKNICIRTIQLQQPVISVKNSGVARKRNAVKKQFSLYDFIHPG